MDVQIVGNFFDTLAFKQRQLDRASLEFWRILSSLVYHWDTLLWSVST
jgi:hypothetical protein